MTGVLIVAATAIATVAAFHRAPYAFLDRFHGRRVEVDLAKLYASIPASARPKTPVPHMTMYVFRDEDSAELLKAMRNELTPKRGYESRNMAPSVPGSPMQDTIWLFSLGPMPTMSPTAMPKEAAYFASGQMADILRRAYESGDFKFNPASSVPPTKSCIVMLMHEETWVEKSLSAVRGFLHMN